MKIVKDYKEDYLIKKNSIASANYLGNYTIQLKYNDKTERIINFKNFLKNSNHPEIRKYLDVNTFKQFKIIDGNLNWNDHDMIFPIGDLYEGKI